MKYQLCKLILPLLLIGLIGCTSPSPSPTPILLIPTIAAQATLPPPVTISDANLPATNTPSVSETPQPTATATETPVIQFAATDTVTPTGLPKLLPTNTSTPVAPLPLGAGFDGAIEAGQNQIHVLDVFEGQTVFSFLRLEAEVDGSQDLYEINLIDLAAEIGSGLNDVISEAAPVRSANFNGPGLPELLTINPKVDGQQSIVVNLTGETGGRYRLYLFDLLTPSEHIVVSQALTLEPGATQAFAVSSNGGKPVAVFARPATSGNVRVAIKGAGGGILTEADYGGVNSYETAYVLPVNTTAYSVEIENNGGEQATFEILIVAIQDGF